MEPESLLIRVPADGTVLHDRAAAGHAGSKVTALATARRGVGAQRAVDFLAFVEGLPVEALPDALLHWGTRYGQPAEVLGSPFALRLPVVVEKVASPPIWAALRLTERVPRLGVVIQDGAFEMWGHGLPPAELEGLLARLRQVVGPAPGVEVRAAVPRQGDLDCWRALELVDELYAS